MLSDFFVVAFIQIAVFYEYFDKKLRLSLKISPQNDPWVVLGIILDIMNL